jgi:xylulokinase
VQRGTVIPLDAEGEPLCNFIVWMDKRGQSQAEWMLNNVGMKDYYSTSGHPISYITGVSKLLWLQNQGKELWDHAAVVAPPDTLFLKWLGCEEFVCAHSSGTFFFPFQIREKKWSSDLASKLGFPLEKLPGLVSSVEIVGTLSANAADHLGLNPGIPLISGGGDGQCAGAGCGVVETGLCMINIGTGTGVQTFLPKPILDPGQVFNCGAHVVPHAWEMEGHTQSSGAAFRWFRDEFGAAELELEHRASIDAFDLLVEQAMQAPPGAGGLLWIPTFNGSTAPLIDQNARGVLINLAISHSRAHVVRALLEGISMEINWMLDSMIATGQSILEVRLAGGGAKNPQWNQIHADILNRPVTTLHNTEAAIVGAAICAAVATGHYSTFSEAAETFVKKKDTIYPRAEQHDIYKDRYEDYQHVFKLLSESGTFSRLRARIS